MSDGGDAEEKPDDADVALVCASTPNGETLGVLRKRGENVEAATLKRLQEGQSIHGDVVRLTPRSEPLLFDVETLHEARGARTGPAQVASEGYRKGWERLFAPKKKPALPD